MLENDIQWLEISDLYVFWLKFHYSNENEGG